MLWQVSLQYLSRIEGIYKMQLFDSHAHYNDEKFDEGREKIKEEIQK